jgi:hypothetical protein
VGAKVSGSTPTNVQGVEKNTKVGSASTSEPPTSTVGAGKELTGRGKREKKMGGNTKTATGNVSDGSAS